MLAGAVSKLDCNALGTSVAPSMGGQRVPVQLTRRYTIIFQMPPSCACH